MSSHNGVKVAKAGQANPSSADPRDNPTDTTQKNLIFNTDLLTFKYLKRDILKINDIGKTYAIYHGLNYNPSYQLWSRNRQTGEIKFVIYDAGSGGPAIVPWTDKQNLYVLIHAGENLTEPFDLIYFIGADDLETVDT